MTITPASIGRIPAAGDPSAVPPKLVVLGAADRDRLDRFVAASPLAHFKQLWEWGEVLEYEGTRAVRLGAERNGELCAALTVYVRKLPGTGLTILSAARGPIVDFSDTAALRCLLSGVGDVARRHRAIFMRVDPEVGQDSAGVRQALREAGFTHLADKRWSDLDEPRIVVTLDLTPSEADLFKRLRETHRRHVRGAVKKGIAIRDARDIEDVLRFREVMTQVGERRGFLVRSDAYYRRLWTTFVQPGRGRLLLAEKGGELLAGVLTLTTGANAWLLYTGLTDAGRAFHPNEALWWEAITASRQQGVTVFNFGGSGTDWPPAPDSPGYAIYTFKRGFDAEAVLLTGYYDLPFNRPLYRLFRLAEEKLLWRTASIVNGLKRLVGR